MTCALGLLASKPSGVRKSRGAVAASILTAVYFILRDSQAKQGAHGAPPRPAHQQLGHSVQVQLAA
jgi:hypothetical protein